MKAAGDLVFLHAVEVEQFIKVMRRQGSAAKKFRRVLAPTLHDRAKHLVVVSAGEENFARVQLKEGTANGPDVDGVVVRDTQDDFRGTVETTDEVRRNLIVRSRRRRTQVANFQNVALLVHKQIIRFEICVQDVTPAEVSQPKENLLAIGPNRTQVQANVPTELFQDLTQVHAKVLKYHAQVTLVIEVSVELNEVHFVLRISFLELLQDANLLHTSLAHYRVLANYLDGNQTPRLGVSCTYDRREHSLAKVLMDMVSSVDQLSEANGVITFRIVPIIHHADIQFLALGYSCGRSMGRLGFRRFLCEHVIVVVCKHIEHLGLRRWHCGGIR